MDNILKEFSLNNVLELIIIKDNILYTQVLHPTNDTINYITNLISNNTQDFIIISTTGEILYESNPNHFKVIVDENNYITVTKDEKIVVMHASNNTFVTGSSKENVNKSFLHLVDNDIIDYDENFNGHQFTSKRK